MKNILIFLSLFSLTAFSNFSATRSTKFYADVEGDCEIAERKVLKHIKNLEAKFKEAPYSGRLKVEKVNFTPCLEDAGSASAEVFYTFVPGLQFEIF